MVHTKGDLLSGIIAVVAIYIFIVLGYIAKKVFKEKIDEKTLILISIYFLQPILVFWGLTSTNIDSQAIKVPLVYITIILISLIFTYIFGKILFKDTKDSSIFTVSNLIGNTGNLGIPLGIALFGEESLIYTSLINIINIFFIYTVGIYFYAKGSYSLKQSLKEMLKIPILWFAFFAIIFNINSISIPPEITKALQMGGYSAMVIQLMIFGIYLYSIKLKEINKKLNISSIVVKSIILPLIGFIFLMAIDYNHYIGAIIFLQIIVPLAVNNVNIASLYDCKPTQVASIVLFSSIVFILLIAIYNNIINIYFLQN
jgi:predicted permease